MTIQQIHHLAGVLDLLQTRDELCDDILYAWLKAHQRGFGKVMSKRPSRKSTRFMILYDDGCMMKGGHTNRPRIIIASLALV